LQRETVAPRPGWRAHVEQDLGFAFHTIGGEPYWDETACYRFTEKQIDELEDATAELEQMALGLVDRVIATGEEAFERLRIPRNAWDAIAGSWQAQEKNLYGRFDLAYDGVSPPRLLEYNADTPTALFETAVVQWDWLQETAPERDQFNSVHEKLIEAWANFGLQGERLYFSAVRDHGEDNGTTEYLRDTAIQAGLLTDRIAIEDIGWDGREFLDLDGQPIRALFKLYPWEWLAAEEFGAHLLSGVARVIEPAWKMVLSNKAALALLWEMAPGHPNLLAASLDPSGLQGKQVRKPIYSREGANVQVLDGARVIDETPGAYGGEGFVYQAFTEIPSFDGNYTVIGSWVIASQPAGIGIREDATAITRDSSRFVPHYFA
jgi:glutathionylspermidine synthase